MTIIQQPDAQLILVKTLGGPTSYGLEAGMLYLPSTAKVLKAEAYVDDAEFPYFRLYNLELTYYYGNRFIYRKTVPGGVNPLILPANKLYNIKAKLWTTMGVYETNTVLINTTGKPTAPRNLTASVNHDQQLITLNWLPPLSWGPAGNTQNDSPEKYEISRYLLSNPNTVYRTTIFPINTSFAFPLPTFAPNQKYGFYITAFNQETKLPSPQSNVAIIDTSLPAFKLFNRSSWNNRTDIPTKIKNQLNKAADSWEQFVTVHKDIVSRVIGLYPKFANGISLKKLTINSDASKSAVGCVPNEVSSVFLPEISAQNGIIAISFSMRLNSYFFDRLTDYDWELALTHHLGHALGLGYINRSSRSGYPEYQLDGANWPNAQRAYNTMRVPPFANARKGRTKIPLDHLGPTVTDDVVGFDGTPINTAGYAPQSDTGSNYWHWGILRNNYNRTTFLHPADHINHDIMGYRVPNQDKMISLLSIKALVDMGYSEVSPNNYQIKRYTISMPQTTITNQQMCKGLSSTLVNREITVASVEEDSSDVDAIINICSIYPDRIVSHLDPDETNPCIKWYCSDSGCVSTNVLEFATSGNLYDTLEECEDNCTDSAGILSSQYIFDTQSKTWRSK